MKKNTLKLTTMLLLFVFNCNYAQTQFQRKVIQSESNSKVLADLVDKMAVEHAANYGKALLLAEKNGWKKRYYDADGNFYELKEVTAEGRPLYYTASNVGAAFTSRANKLMPNGGLGLSLTGKDLYVGVWDQDNANFNHLDFQGRVFNYDQNTNPASYHASHVTGTMISSGVNSDQQKGRGIAYEAYAYVSNWTNDLVEMATLANNNGLLLSNHSYGLAASDPSFPEYIFGAYRADSRDIDNVAFNAPYYQPVVAAGNDRNKNPGINPTKNGYDLLTNFSTAKNAIVVAAVNELNAAGYTGPADVVMSNFSSYGPTDDNRIKPDISMKGVNVYSTTNAANNNGYGTISGTSMASPGVTGTLLLLQQHFLNITGNFMRSATLRGLMCHTADEAGIADGPDPRFGWGLINAERAAVSISSAYQNDKNVIITEFDARTTTPPALANGGIYTQTIKANGNEPLMVTIAWTDRAGVTNTSTVDLKTPTLINDLDVRVTKGSEVFFPWKLSDVNTDPAIKGDNIVDNIEKIDIKQPAAELYTVTVSHKGTLVGGSQDFSLIISGIDKTNLNTKDSDFKVFKIWPNATFGKVRVSLESESSENAYLRVFDLAGREVLSKKLEIANNILYDEINIEDQTAGVYFFKIVQGKRMSVVKVIKK
jgi:hypothetical protein